MDFCRALQPMVFEIFIIITVQVAKSLSSELHWSEKDMPSTHPACLGEHLYFWVELTLDCVLFLLQSMQPIVVLSQLHSWPNP